MFFFSLAVHENNMPHSGLPYYSHQKLGCFQKRSKDTKAQQKTLQTTFISLEIVFYYFFSCCCCCRCQPLYCEKLYIYFYIFKKYIVYIKNKISADSWKWEQRFSRTLCTIKKTCVGWESKCISIYVINFYYVCNLEQLITLCNVN